MKQGLVRLLYNLGKVHGVDITYDNVCSSMLSCFYSHLLSTGRPISSYMYFHIIVLFSIDIYSQINKFYSVIIFSLLINVILLFNCLVLILPLYIHFLSVKHSFPYLNISWIFT